MKQCSRPWKTIPLNRFHVDFGDPGPQGGAAKPSDGFSAFTDFDLSTAFAITLQFDTHFPHADALSFNEPIGAHVKILDGNELQSFAKSEGERKVLAMYRTMRLAGSPYFLPPETPKDRVEILQEAMSKTFKDPEFLTEAKKLGGDEPTPLMPEAHGRAIRELPRDPSIIDLFKKITGPALFRRNN